MCSHRIHLREATVPRVFEKLTNINVTDFSLQCFVSDLFARGNAVFFVVLRENRKKLFSRAFVSTYVIDVICCFG